MVAGTARAARLSAGGARAAGGFEFQAEVFAWWAAHAVAEREPGLGLKRSVRIDAVGCETSLSVDDVGVALDDGGFILVQAKGGLRLDAKYKDLVAAVAQIVDAVRTGLGVSGTARTLNVAHDRVVIATNQGGSRSFERLGKVCERLRDLPFSLPLESAVTTKDERTALGTLRRVVESCWTEAAGSAPTAQELRDLFRVLVVQRLDFDSDAGAHRVRGETMLEAAQLDQPFEALTRIGLGVARTRAWKLRSTLADAVGVPSGHADGQRDVDRLRTITQRTLARLAEHRVLRTPESEVRLSRSFPELTGLGQESVLITGAPGAGKSGVVANLADALTGDLVVLAVDAVPTEPALAQLQWGLSVGLAEALTAWEGPDPGTLLLDGLDAHRGGVSWLADLVQELRGTRWRVIATIRLFDLTHSYRWRQLFPGAPLGRAADPTLSRVRHLLIPDLGDDDLAQVAAASPTLGALLTAGGPPMRELLANPFTLSLAADLVPGVPASQLAGLRTQVEMLAQYWQVRVRDGEGGHARAETCRQITQRMAEARTLELTPTGGLGGSDPTVTEQLIHAGVLQEVDDGRLVSTTKPIRFRHHIVFDYALAAGLHDGTSSRLPDVLTTDPNFVVFGRPAIDFHLADLWFSCENRTSFWDTALALAEPARPLAVAAAAAVAIRQITTDADVRVLANVAATRPSAAVPLVHHLANALLAADENTLAHVTAHIAAFDGLVGALRKLWLDAGESPHLQAAARYVGALHAIAPLPRPGSAARGHAATIVRLLAIALADPATQAWVGERILDLIVGALPLDDHALPMLLRVLEPAVTAVWGLLPLRPVLASLADIAQVDPSAAGQLAAAPFLFDASADQHVPLGASQILPMRMSWSDAHNGLCYVVATRGWAPFEATYPVAAMEALANILEAVTDSDSGATPVFWNGLPGRISAGSLLSAGPRRHFGDLVDSTVAAMGTRAAAGVSDEASLTVWIRRVSHPDAWTTLLRTAAAEPALGLQVRGVLLESGGLLRDFHTRAAAIRLAAVLSPLISTSDHAQLEQIITGLPAAEPDETLRPFLAETRDEALLVLDPSHVHTATALARLAELALAGVNPAPPRPPRPPLVGAGPADHDQLAAWGVDPTTLPAHIRSAMINAGDALAADTPEPDRWSALKAAVTAERDTETGSVLQTRFRDRLGQLVTVLVDSHPPAPDDPSGAWVAELLLALAGKNALPPPPDGM